MAIENFATMYRLRVSGYAASPADTNGEPDAFHGFICDDVAWPGLVPHPASEVSCNVYVVVPEDGLCRFEMTVPSLSLNHSLFWCLQTFGMYVGEVDFGGNPRGRFCGVASKWTLQSNHMVDVRLATKSEVFVEVPHGDLPFQYLRGLVTERQPPFVE